MTVILRLNLTVVRGVSPDSAEDARLHRHLVHGGRDPEGSHYSNQMRVKVGG